MTAAHPGATPEAVLEGIARLLTAPGTVGETFVRRVRSLPERTCLDRPVGENTAGALMPAGLAPQVAERVEPRYRGLTDPWHPR